MKWLVILFIQLSGLLITTDCRVIIGDEPSVMYSCPDLGQLRHGSKVLYSRGMYASFYCNVGLKLYGSNSLRCLRNGDWDLPMPICIDSGCAHPGKIVNGFQKDYESFSIITYQCYDGYLLKGSSLIYCDGATWNDTVPECVRSTARVSSAPLYNCHDPGEVDNAVRNDDPLHGTISYICIGDYKLLGSQVIECQFNKKWSSSKPTCASKSKMLIKKQKGCVELSVPMNASVIPIYDGAAMLYQCDSGYEIIGSTIIYCDGRNWNDSIPQCVHLKSESDRTHNVAVPRPSGVSDNENDSLFRIDDGMRCDFTNVRQPNSGYGIITKRDSYGSFYRVVKYFCAEGYKLIGGDLELICTHGKWVGDFPVCSPDDPCVVNNGGCEHKCKNINGQVQCECNKGYELKNGIKCIDINECLDGKGHGPCQHSCTNTNGGYSCSCFTGHILMEDGINCQGNCQGLTIPTCDGVNVRLGKIKSGGPRIAIYVTSQMPECDTLRTRRTGTSSYIFTSELSGFEVALHKSWRQDDFLPCEDDNGGCSHICTNDDNQAVCSCYRGYYIDQADGKTCIDINECILATRYICPNAKCVNTPGSYTCECQDGFYRTAYGSCIDRDECQQNNGGCVHHCTNTQGSYLCHCPIGLVLGEDKHSCVDLNECSLQQFSRRCSFGCENTYGSFRCTCPRGFITAPNGIQCLDINECLQNNGRGPCADRCVNTHGSYVCYCTHRGHQLADDGYGCDDINECLIEGTCHHNCINLPGSYQCTCHDGYLIMPDGKTCDGCRINSFKSSSTNECIECPRNSHTKGTGKTSLNDCVCNSGFTGDPGNGINCQDINECQTDNFGCSDNCVNTPGSAYCVCNVGYRLENEKVCIDIDECSLGNGGCEHTCNNTDGSFACTCKDGYIIDPLDPYLCADIDECLHNNGGCDQRCVNYPGGYLCECDGASIVDDDRKTCKPVVCSALAIPARGRVKPRGKCTGSNPDTLLEVGTECVFDCLKGYELEGSDRRICEPNGRWSGSETSCKPVYCPAIVPPENGRLLPASCQNSQSPYQSQCVFTCDEGYRLSGPRITKCLFNKKWNSRDREPMCIKDVQEPVITCSPDVTVDLDQGNSTAIVSIPTPVYEHGSLRVNRPTHNAPFPAGTTLVYFTVVSDEDEKKAANCTTKVNVIDKEPPKVLHCPESMFVETAEQYPTDIQWEDATFTDNVGIKDILPFFRNPGGTLTWGIHHIKYIAKDAANNAAECSFNIVIEPKSCGLPDGPLNGVPDCVDWLYGEICNPTCNEGYVFYEGTAKSVYVCGVDAKWSPSRQLPDCTEYSNLGSNGVCPPGTELKSYEQFEEEVCVTCPRGMYMPQNETTCIACQLGYYQDEFGSTDCKLCPSGFTTYHNSSIDLSDCKAAVITTEAYGKSDPDVTKSTPVTHYITETYDDKKK
ncbi:uncharacterized protein LOC102806860 [Saccoglossus kowalevskii]